jgi:hypothetical protein
MSSGTLGSWPTTFQKEREKVFSENVIATRGQDEAAVIIPESRALAGTASIA